MNNFTKSVLVFCGLFLSIFNFNLFAQTSQGIGTSNPNTSSLLDLTSTTAGLLVPRMTTVQRDAIITPANGLLIFNTITNLFNFYDGTAWKAIPQAANANTWFEDGNTLSAIKNIGTLSAHDLPFITAGSERMRIKQNGAVGIGTSTPTSPLHVVGDVKIGQNGSSVTPLSIDALGISLSSDASYGVGGCSIGNTDGWQSFTAINSGLLNRIDVSINTNSPNIGTMTIYAGQGTGGTVLTTQSYNFGASGGVQTRSVTFTTKPFISTGQLYTIRMNTAAWSVSCSPSYSGGQSETGGDRPFTALIQISTPGLNFTSSGQLGIGTASPSSALHVVGGATISGLAGPGIVTADASGNLAVSVGGAITGSGANGQVTFWNGTTTQTGNSNLFWDNTNVRLGIGTNTPTVALALGGDAAQVIKMERGTTAINGNNLTIEAGGAGIGSNNTSAGNLILSGGLSTGNALGGDIVFRTYNAGSAGTTANTASTKMILTSTGDLGIGVAGLPILAGQTNQKTITASSVSIPTTDAPMVLEIRGSSNTNDSGVVGKLDFINIANSSNNYNVARIEAIRGSSNQADGELRFYTRSAGSTIKRMSIDKFGNVGIGLTAAAERLHVKGNVMIPAANDYKYSSPKTHYFNIPAIGFRGGIAVPNTYSSGTQSYTYFTAGTVGNSEYVTSPIFIPDGSIITGVEAYVYDNDGTYNIGNIDLMRRANVSLNATVISNVSAGTTGTSTSIQTVSSVENTTVDNAANSYFVRVNLIENNSIIRLYGVRITYTVINAD